MSVQRRVTARLRRTWPGRSVTRDVQGVRLTLPWSHKLPDYAEQFPTYGQNLVAVAEALRTADGEPFVMVDVGANIGDSALQVLAKVDARVLCVEGDTYWLDYLHRNVDGDPRIRVVPALVLPEASDQLAAVRRNGTTHFVEGGDGQDSAAGLAPRELRERAAGLGRVRLVKSDTDGYDVRIVPAMAAAWQDEHPVLFFEYDPALTRAVGDDAPTQVWSALAALGYDHVVVWDNFGNGLGTMPLADAAARSSVLDADLAGRGYHYWDVAVVHRDDTAVRSGLDALVGGRAFAAGDSRGA